MIRRLIRRVLSDDRGGSAVEMALVAPLLLGIMFGAAELGNYFLDEHTLAKAVRDGARFAARRSFAEYTSCSGVSATLRDATRNVVMYGYTSGTSVLTPNIAANDITVGTRCATTAGSQTMKGIYVSRANGAQVVTVTAVVPYRPLGFAFGVNAGSLHLNATSEAAVTGT